MEGNDLVHRDRFPSSGRSRKVLAVTAPLIVVDIRGELSRQVQRLEATELRLTNALGIHEELRARVTVLDRTD
ncbi:MAG: hypothetical protein HOV81_23985 [Kofleriaceae bacterium]|nr:hypothetical protein [Kofleriaceae bacterium]